MSTDKPDHEIDLEEVKRRFSDELEGVDIEVGYREIGNGPQYCLRAYREGTATVVWGEERWYAPDEFRAYVEGMKHLDGLFRAAEREREH